VSIDVEYDAGCKKNEGLEERTCDLRKTNSPWILKSLYRMLASSKLSTGMMGFGQGC